MWHPTIVAYKLWYLSKRKPFWRTAFFAPQTPCLDPPLNSGHHMSCSNEFCKPTYVDIHKKRQNLSLRITLNHNPRCNFSSLGDISANLIGNNALWRVTCRGSSRHSTSKAMSDVLVCWQLQPKNPEHYTVRNNLQKCTFAIIYDSVNLPPWKMKFAPGSKFTLVKNRWFKQSVQY